MRTFLAFRIVVGALVTASWLHAKPAYCVECASSAQCFNSGGCFRGCHCYQPKGPGTPGFCG